MDVLWTQFLIQPILFKSWDCNYTPTSQYDLYLNTYPTIQYRYVYIMILFSYQQVSKKTLVYEE